MTVAGPGPVWEAGRSPEPEDNRIQPEEPINQCGLTAMFQGYLSTTTCVSFQQASVVSQRRYVLSSPLVNISLFMLIKKYINLSLLMMSY